MNAKDILALLAAALAAAACGGGGSPADFKPGSPAPSTEPITGPNRFLLFPNPQVMDNGNFQTDTTAYANAYYEAIDPQNTKDTLDKWKAANNWDTGTGEQITVVFGDTRDLGYGRRMNARRNADGTLAFFVENYLVRNTVDYAYSNLNLDAAIVRASAHFIGVNAIEFSPGPGGGVPFAKWYNFSSTTGQRAAVVDLDGRGTKAMPGPCISCHGGRGEALTPATSPTGKPLFNLIQFSESRARGDVEGHMHPFDVDTFGFSTSPGFSRAEQEAAMKTINRWILCTYPLPAPSTAPEDQCRRPANRSEWQGTAAALIKAFYGGDGLPSATFNDTYVPEGWLSAGQSTLYTKVVKPSCRTCHVMRGSGGNSDQDFMTYAKFSDYADRVKMHVNDRGNMPLAKIVYDAFYLGEGPELVATFLTQHGITARDSAGVALKPGRPLADPGPARVMAPGTIRLSGSQSLFASTYAWSIVSGPAGGAISDAASAQPTFSANAPGTYVLRLVTTGNGLTSVPTQFEVVVKSDLAPAPSAVRFADVKNVLLTSGCTNCHSVNGTLPRPPLFYTTYDRNGDGTVGDATDDAWFFAEVRSRVNLTEVAASPILRKPSGNHHGGALQPGFDTTKSPGAPERANYDLFLNWILNGAPN